VVFTPDGLARSEQLFQEPGDGRTRSAASKQAIRIAGGTPPFP
jgi:hypothetical protein